MKTRIMLLTCVFALCFALPAVAQNAIDNSDWGPRASTTVGPAAQNSPSRVGWSDDFNRADGPIGGDWTVTTGGIGILNNQGVGTASGNSSIYHNLASEAHDTSICSADFFHPTGGLVYIALVSGWASTSTNVFVKIQDNNSDGLLDRVFFYTGLNGSPWSGYSPAYYYDLATPTMSGNISLYFTNNGDTANFDVDNGTAVEHFECSGVNNISGLGTGFGIGTYNQPAFDNWVCGTPGPDVPTCDIKCNGDDGPVSMYTGTNAMVTYDFHAGIGAGAPVDLWLAFKHPFGFFTYDGIGPYMGWNMGLGSAFYTGPLADMSGTCLDFALGINSYKAFIGIDTAANGVLNMGSLYAMDMVAFDVVAAPKIYSWDDGSTENLLAWSSGGDLCWLNGWKAYAGGETLLDMQCIFGSALYPGYAPGNGSNCSGYIWDDPTNDSDPSDCALLATEALVVAQVDTDIYNVFPLTAPVVVSGVFFVGCNMPHGVGQYCMPMDQTGTYIPGTCWYCGTNTTGGFDPNVLTNNQYTPAEYGVFNCIRAGY